MYKQEFRNMAIGWFILKMASDYGIYTGSSWNYGTANSINTRLKCYKRTTSQHVQMITYVVDNWNKKISGGQPTLTNEKIYDIALQLLRYLNLPIINPNNIATKVSKTKSTKNTKTKFPFEENDYDGEIVYYDDDVKENESVEGLCSFLEEHYKSIVDHVSSLFNVNWLRKIPVILSKECPPPTKINNDVGTWIKHQLEIYGNNLTAERINEIAAKKVSYLDVVGEFVRDMESPYIIIYYRNVIEPNRIKYFAKILGILAHEFFHFFHFCITRGKNFSKKYKWEYSSVNESLAEISSYIYLESNSIINQYMLDVAKEKYKFWKEYFGSKVPYAQAFRYFDKGINLDFRKAMRVLAISEYKMLDAYNELIR